MLALRRSPRDALLYVRDSAYLLRRRVRDESGEGLLIVRMDGIGDFIVWLNAAEAIRRAFRNEHITLAANAAWADLALDTNYFDEVIPVRSGELVFDPRYRYEVFDRIRDRTFELALHPTYTRSRGFRDAEAIIRVARARRKIGFDGERVLTWQRRLSGTWYDHRIASDRGPRREMERNAEFVYGLGIRDVTIGTSVYPSPPQSGFPGNYYVLSPGAGSRLRRWDISSFALLADRIYAETGWHGVVVGGNGEAELGRTILQLARAPLHDRVGMTSIRNLMALIAGARLLVGNETGAVHMAAAVGTPNVCITGGGHFDRFVPYRTADADRPGTPAVVSHHLACFGCNWNCVHEVAADEAPPCISLISVDDVWTEVCGHIRTDRRRDDMKVWTRV